MVLHHVSLGTNDLRRAKAFYDPLMSELGLRLIKETERIIAYGLTETVFSIERPVNGERAVAGTGRTSPREATPDRPRLPRSGARQRREGRGRAWHTIGVRQELLCCVPAGPRWEQARDRDIRLIGPRDGIDAADEMFNRFGIPSLFVTANTDPHTRARAQAVHPLGFIEKPANSQRLRAALRSVPQ